MSGTQPGVVTAQAHPTYIELTLKPSITTCSTLWFFRVHFTFARHYISGSMQQVKIIQHENQTKGTQGEHRMLDMLFPSLLDELHFTVSTWQLSLTSHHSPWIFNIPSFPTRSNQVN